MKLCWIDLETTGLDYRRDLILAYGVRITDEKLNVLAETERVVRHSKGLIKLLEPAPVVIEMHTKNGLWEKVEASKLESYQAEAELASFLKENLKGEKGVLAGNSVHFDRSFLADQWPSVLKHVTHRHLDVSVFKVLEGVWGLPASLQPKGETVHTPLADLDVSIAHLKAVREFLMGAAADGCW